MAFCLFVSAVPAPESHAEPVQLAASVGPSWQYGFDSLSIKMAEYEFRAGTGPLGAPGVVGGAELGWREWWVVADLVVDGSLGEVETAQAGRWLPEVRDLTLSLGRSVPVGTAWLRLDSGAGLGWPRYYLAWQASRDRLLNYRIPPREAIPALTHSLTLGLPVGRARTTPGPAPGWAVVVGTHFRWTAAAWLGPGHTEQGLVPLSIGVDAGLRGQVALHRR